MPREIPIQKPGECLDMLLEGRTVAIGEKVGNCVEVVFVPLRDERRW